MDGKKILFADIDGTLLNDKREIPEENVHAISRAVKAGHSVVIATGRPLDSGKKIVEELGLTMPGCYMIAYNGAIIYDCGNDRILEKKFVPYPCVKELFERGKKAGLYVQTYNKTQIVTTRDCPELQYYREHTKLTCQITDDVMSVLEEEPQKVMLIHLTDKKKLEKFQEENMEWQRGKCHSFFSMDTYLEYAPLDSTKASGIRYLCEYLGIPIENTVAAGDERNDIEMLQAAHIGAAMKNAKDEVKANADYVTERTNNESGVAEIIEKFIL